MNTLTHPSEEIMALLDGELTAAEAKAVSDHIDQCAECAALRDELRRTSESLATWQAPAIFTEIDQAIEERIERSATRWTSARQGAYTPLTIRNWRLWAIGGGGAVAAVLGIVMIAFTMIDHEDDFFVERKVSPQVVQSQASEGQRAEQAVSANAYYDARAAQTGLAADRETVPLPDRSMANLAKLEPGVAAVAVPPPPAPLAPSVSAPMIARSVSITILVKNIAESRQALDTVLAQHHGYAAQLNINTPETGARSFQSSLRIPASDLTSSLEALRTLGRVQTETQSSEEVTQQHTDLVARLTNARETEARLRAILTQRTGKMQDVLDVEDKIAETRGEIEQMEAEQKALEHRVDFASIDLKLVEEYKAQLDNSPTSVGTEVHNSLVAGLHHAGASLLGLVLFFEEYGPVLLIWVAILGGPAFLIWRRYRRARID